MNPLVAQMMGRTVAESDEVVPVPSAMPPRASRRRRDRRLSTAAEMLGLRADGTLREADEESLIPDDAEPLDIVSAPSGIKLDQKLIDRDKQPPQPASAIGYPEEEEELLTPKDALVAPDVTPHAYVEIDPSEVPPPKEPPKTSMPDVAGDAMSVLLGRKSGPEHPLPEEPIETAESVQATVNSLLKVPSEAADALLRQGQAMPHHVPGQAKKIMEAFYKYGPKPG
jgi:hypothetical protein